jgi:hypothetical protein
VLGCNSRFSHSPEQRTKNVIIISEPLDERRSLKLISLALLVFGTFSRLPVDGCSLNLGSFAILAGGDFLPKKSNQHRDYPHEQISSHTLVNVSLSKWLFFENV